MKFVIEVLKGCAIGAGAILPGISSGVLMVIFGMYEKLVDSILGFFKDVKVNTRYLFPIMLGISIGIVLFGNILRLLFNNFEVQTKFIFIGLIVGGIPALIKTANIKKGFRLHYLTYTIITLFLTVMLIYIENNITSNTVNTSFLYLILCGFIMSIGIVVPGVSSTVLLMLLGVYDIYLASVSTVNLYVLIPMGIGLILGGLIFLCIIKFCLKKFHAQTYYSIIGFVLGSVVILFPRNRV